MSLKELGDLIFLLDDSEYDSEYEYCKLSVTEEK